MHVSVHVARARACVGFHPPVLAILAHFILAIPSMVLLVILVWLPVMRVTVLVGLVLVLVVSRRHVTVQVQVLVDGRVVFDRRSHVGERTRF